MESDDEDVPDKEEQELAATHQKNGKTEQDGELYVASQTLQLNRPESPPSKKAKLAKDPKPSTATEAKKPNPPTAAKGKDNKPIASIFAKPVKKEPVVEKSESPDKDDEEEEGEDELESEVEDEQEGEAAVKLYVKGCRLPQLPSYDLKH